MKKLSELRAAHPTLCEIIRFLIVGGVATLVDMFVMGCILYAFDPSLYPHFYNAFIGGGDPSTAAAVVGTGCGFISGLVVNYILSVLFVFIHKGKSKSVGGFFIFALLSAVGLGIHLLGMYIGYTLIGINEWIVKIFLTLVVLVYNYISKRKLLFKKQPDTGAAVPTPRLVPLDRTESGEKKRLKISMVVPCYNEEECIDEYYAATEKAIVSLPADFEYIFVDDGSTDGTLLKIRELARRDAKVKYISFSRNFGKEAAMLAGLKAADGDLVGLMDVDLQDPPELIKDMYDGIVSEDYDCVGSRRVTRKGESKLRSMFARAFYRIFNRHSSTKLVGGTRDFRLMTREMTDAVLSMSERERFSKGIFAWVGFKTKWLEYENIKRVGGTTKWTFKKLAKYAVNGVEDFTDAPLKFSFAMFVITLLGAVALAIVDIVFACTARETDTALIVLPVVLFVASMLFMGMGIMGEYVKKIYRETKARPTYVVRETHEDMARAKSMGTDVSDTPAVPEKTDGEEARP